VYVLSPHGWNASVFGELERPIQLVFVDLFHRHVHMAAASQSSVEIRDHHGPVFREHKLHRIDAHHAMEFTVESQLLKTDLLELN
jgi:hypothetical protein